MLLKYVPSLKLECGNISSLEFSKCGEILAVVNVVGEISLWNMQFGSRYNPTLRLDSAAATTTAVWVDDMVFICGLSNGSLVTCKLMDSGTVTTKAEFRVHFTQEQVAENEVTGLSYHRSLKKLAVCSREKIRLYLRGEPWKHERRLPEPFSPGKSQNPMRIVTIAWLPHTENELLVAYMYHGVFLLDVNTSEVIRSFNHEDTICKGTLCSTVETFVAIDNHERVVLYHFRKGLRWALPSLKNITSVTSVHRDTGFVAGGHGVAHLVDIPRSLVSQVLRQSAVSNQIFLALSAYQDDDEQNFKIATATSDVCIVWKTVAVGVV